MSVPFYSHLDLKGNQLLNARMEHTSALPSPGNAGRVIFLTTTNTPYYDNGTTWQIWVGAGAAGDMLKSTYDTNNDGKVNAAEVADAVPWTGVSGKPSTFTPAAHTHTLQDVVTAGSTINDNIYSNATPDASTALVTKSYADGLVVGLIRDRGSYDASVNTFPATGGSGTSGAVMKGDLWFISVAGTLGGEAVTVGDSVRAMADNPGQTASNWSIIQVNIQYVPENVTNKSTDSTFAANSDTLYPSQKAVKTAVDSKLDITNYAELIDAELSTNTVVSVTGGTAPSGSTNHRINYVRIGRSVQISIYLNYGTPGTGNTNFTITNLEQLPAPLFPTGWTGASIYIARGLGLVQNSQSAVGTQISPLIRHNASANSWEIVNPSAFASTNARYISITFSYIT